MYGGDFSRKKNLVEYGFRLPSAIDNRPLKFNEFDSMLNQVIYVSATPADFELSRCDGVVVEQVIRPTGLIDPQIDVRPLGTQVDDLLEEVALRVEKDERVLVTTLTKRMAEELTKYMDKLNFRCRYIHSDVDTLDRVQILADLRKGVFDVLIGVNLLREGLDLPEVSLVAILDADKEGFLRSHRSLTQTAGRAARNINGRVIMYADKITKSMKLTIDETNRRRTIQMDYNLKNNITPTQIERTRENTLKKATITDEAGTYGYIVPDGMNMAADPVIAYLTKEQIEKSITRTKEAMHKAARTMDFIEAARLRDEMFELQKLADKKD